MRQFSMSCLYSFFIFHKLIQSANTSLNSNALWGCFPARILKNKHKKAVAKRCSVKNMFLQIFTKFTGKHQCQSLFSKKRFQHRCFLVNLIKLLRTHFLAEHLWWLLTSRLIMGSAFALSSPQQPMTKVVRTTINYYDIQFSTKGLFYVIFHAVKDYFWETYGNNFSNFLLSILHRMRVKEINLFDYR